VRNTVSNKNLTLVHRISGLNWNFKEQEVNLMKIQVIPKQQNSDQILSDYSFKFG